MKINQNFDNLVPNYLFAEIAKKTSAYAAAHPEQKLIRLGIGDVTLPLPPTAVQAMKVGAGELSLKETFKGYPEYEGYDFVREAVAKYYAGYGVTVEADEVFISDGAKSDTGNIGDIFGADNTVMVPDPVYPVYVDANIMAGRRIVYAPGTRENRFLPMPDDNIHADIIYLCSPNNPTGAAYSADQLKAWVDYAIKNDAVILYDAAYEAFIEDDCPRSIFAIDGARECAIEFCSLSKTAGFTGVRCGYTVIPKELTRDGHNIHALWYRRQACPIPCSAPRPPYSPRKGKRNSKPISNTIKRTRGSSPRRSMSWGYSIRAAKTRRISGSSAPKAWEAGNSSITFSKTLRLSERPARASAVREKAIFD